MLENIDQELVRCRPCGYVMKKSELDKLGVCPACGMPHNVFEPYRERVSPKRLFLLDLDIHPIVIHIPQTFVALIPALILFRIVFPNFIPEIITDVVTFAVYLFPVSLVLSFISGIVDGLTRFKTLDTQFLKWKMYYGTAILIVSIALLVLFILYPEQKFGIINLLLGLFAFFFAVKLGMLGKKLSNVILPGTYQHRKKKIIPQKEETTIEKESVNK